jgi:hypothetical protein
MSKNPELPSGCLLGNFTQELSDTHPEIRLLCARRFAEWAAALKHDLVKRRRSMLPRHLLTPRVWLSTSCPIFTSISAGPENLLYVVMPSWRAVVAVKKIFWRTAKLTDSSAYISRRGRCLEEGGLR